MPGPYELYLMRHGSAGERGNAWPDDGKRPLSENGMTRMRKSMRGLAEAGLTIDVVLTSPLVRTRQTAEIVAAGLQPRPAGLALDSLAPGGAQAARSAPPPPASSVRVTPSSSRKARSAGSTWTSCRRRVPASCGGF